MRARWPAAVSGSFVRACRGRAAAHRRAERQRQDEPAAHSVRAADADRGRGALGALADPRAARGLFAPASLSRPRAGSEGRSHAFREPRHRLPAGRRAGAQGSAELGIERVRSAGASGAQALAGAAAPRGARAPFDVRVGAAVAARRAFRRAGHSGGELHRGVGQPPSCRRRQRRLHDAPAGRHRYARPRGAALIFPVAGTIVRRDLLLALRRRSDVATALLFFVIVASLFPLGIGAEPNLLRAIAPGVIWVAALLSCMLSLGRLFAADHADGTLEQLLLSSEPLGVIAAAKALAHWLVSGLPLVLIAPLIALQYDLAAPLYPVLALSLLLGTPVLSLIGAIGAALTLGLRGGGVLLSLLVLPLYVPVLIMGAGSVDMAAAGLAADGQLLLLAALLVVAAAFTPWAIAAALRISVE